MEEEGFHFTPAKEKNTLSDRERKPGSRQRQFEGEKKPLPKNVSEYIQKVRDELKEYENHKAYYEKKRKREIVLDLIDLLEEYNYPKEWLRLIIAQELGDYISTSYIEKILAEKYPDEEKKVKKQSTSQTEEIPQNDDKSLIEVSSSGTSIVSNNGDDSDNISTNGTSTREASTEIKSDIVQQAEEGTREIVRDLQQQVKDLQTKCNELDQLANESVMWKERFNQLQLELKESKSNEMKIINGKTEIEFGPEFLPLIVEYNPQTNQFSARIPQEVIERVLSALRRR